MIARVGAVTFGLPQRSCDAIFELDRYTRTHANALHQRLNRFKNNCASQLPQLSDRATGTVVAAFSFVNRSGREDGLPMLRNCLEEF